MLPFSTVSCSRILLSSRDYFKLVYFSFLLCFLRDMFLGITGRDILHYLSIDPYTLSRTFVQACFFFYKLDRRLARHSQILDIPALLLVFLIVPSVQTDFTRYYSRYYLQEPTSSLSAYLETSRISYFPFAVSLTTLWRFNLSLLVPPHRNKISDS